MSGAGSDRPALRCEVHRTSLVGLIEVAGVLRQSTKARLWEAVRKVLSDTPQAIVLDLTGLEAVEDEPGMAVFGALGRLVADQVEGELILAVPSFRLRVALQRAAPLFVRVFPARADAWLAAEQGPLLRQVRLQLRANPYAPRSARQLVDGVCAFWELGSDLQERARIVATELVSNAVAHAMGDIEVSVTVRRFVLRLEVSDHTTVLPGLSAPASDVTGGLGLHLVTTLASHWGITPTPHGKIVWADLMLRPDPLTP